MDEVAETGGRRVNKAATMLGFPTLCGPLGELGTLHGALESLEKHQSP